MGCAGSKPPPEAPLVAFSRVLETVPWGVLGEGLRAGGKSWETTVDAPKPDGTVLFIDPASVAIVRDPYFRPGDAGGAAGAIYRFLGIDKNEQFPPDVAADLHAVGDATYKRYGYPHAIHVIHVIGPDFKREHVEEVQAVQMLADAYAAVLRLARDQPRELLRLCPISSGIYAGDHRERMAEITAQALVRGFELVDAEDASASARLPGGADGCARVELCLFEGKTAAREFDGALRAALDQRTAAVTRGTAAGARGEAGSR